MSFYKEEQDGETSSYIHARARLSDKTLIATLHEVIDEVVAAVDRARRTLGDGTARIAWDSFIRGYIAFHINNPRYRLQDILDGHMVDAGAV